jgi:hypothetical protein
MILRCVLLLGMLLAGACFAQEPPTDRQVKAAFVFRFAEYVRWPEAAFASADSPLVIGVLGDRLAADELAAVTSGRRSRGRPVVVRALNEREAPGGLHVLFVTEPLNARLRQVIRAVEGPVLIVTEAGDALGQGSVINFVSQSQRVRFEIGLGAAQSRNLVLSSALLSLAINVRKESSVPQLLLARGGPVPAFATHVAAGTTWASFAP